MGQLKSFSSIVRDRLNDWLAWILFRPQVISVPLTSPALHLRGLVSIHPLNSAPKVNVPPSLAEPGRRGTQEDEANEKNDNINNWIAIKNTMR